jgi:hypothetical protein
VYTQNAYFLFSAKMTSFLGIFHAWFGMV